jgi:hypothetical protein
MHTDSLGIIQKTYTNSFEILHNLMCVISRGFYKMNANTQMLLSFQTQLEFKDITVCIILIKTKESNGV